MNQLNKAYFIEGHGKWHHKIPNEEEFQEIAQILKIDKHEKA